MGDLMLPALEHLTADSMERLERGAQSRLATTTPSTEFSPD